MDAKIWNSMPYIACLLLAFVSRAAFPAAVATAFMLALDAFIATSALLETHPSWLLALSLVSTLKLVIVLPIGLAVGWLIQKHFAPMPVNGAT
ncbi:MAG: hypothetical protein KF771_12310 [Burkholderiales bacterium]|nr:hypothetical protein [Burkholderiales bacterium]